MKTMLLFTATINLLTVVLVEIGSGGETRLLPNVSQLMFFTTLVFVDVTESYTNIHKRSGRISQMQYEKNKDEGKVFGTFQKWTEGVTVVKSTSCIPNTSN